MCGTLPIISILLYSYVCLLIGTQKPIEGKNRKIYEFSKDRVEFSEPSVQFKVSNDNRNLQGTFGSDPNESTTEVYPNIANSLSGPNPNIVATNKSMNLDASAAMASVLQCMTL